MKAKQQIKHSTYVKTSFYVLRSIATALSVIVQPLHAFSEHTSRLHPPTRKSFKKCRNWNVRKPEMNKKTFTMRIRCMFISLILALVTSAHFPITRRLKWINKCILDDYNKKSDYSQNMWSGTYFGAANIFRPRLLTASRRSELEFNVNYFN